MLTHARIATIGGGFAGRALLTALFVVLLTVLATPAMAQTGSGFFDAIYVPNRDSDSISVVDLDTSRLIHQPEQRARPPYPATGAEPLAFLSPDFSAGSLARISVIVN